MVDRDQDFHISLIKGQIGKELVRALLEKSNYKVYAFGYESSLSPMKYDVKDRMVPLTDSNNRLRSMPDLIVYDESKKESHFVEVKFATSDSHMRVRLKLMPLRWYKKYWNDSILVLVCTAPHVFYYQKIRDLDIPENFRSYWFDIEKSFMTIEKHFTNVSNDTIRKLYPVLDRFSQAKLQDSDDSDDS